MNKITEVTRRDILDIIKDGFVEEYSEPVWDSEAGQIITEQKIYMPFYGRLDELTFFSRIYNLQELPSYDRRYSNALGDINCHLQWGDYADCWFFQDRRFCLMHGDGDETLLQFLCEMLHPAVRAEKSAWKMYLEKFNQLLKEDGYELYAIQHISGRDIFGAREYRENTVITLPESLFSVRYKELIHYGDGNPTDNISHSVSHSAKIHLGKIMTEFAEPMLVQRNRYDSWKDKTNALDEAILRFNEFIGVPLINSIETVFSQCSLEEYLAAVFTPFLFDVVEYQYDELSKGEKQSFIGAINESFRGNNVPFQISEEGLIELIPNLEIVTPEIITSIEAVPEQGIRELLKDAIEKYRQPSFQSHRDAVEKIWDALERLKSFHTTLDKKASATKIINDISNGQTEFISLFNDEFLSLTKIGNNFRIRHHETDKAEITDIRHYDYLFNRCLALISTAIKYLQ